jgi:DNA-binding NarL/FixJ family response regulator
MLMEGTPEFDLAFATGSVEEALRITPQLRPRVILLDVHLPGMSGIEGVGIIQERFPESVVLMLTVFEDEDRIFEALCNGAGGYLLKKTPPARLLEYVSEAATGGAPMSPEIAAKVVRLFARLPKKVALDENLTPQETSFLKLLAEGHSYASSASELGVSVNTVRNYVRSIYDKLHVHSKSEAVSKAMRAGLI